MKNKTLFGLPEKVLHCSKCLMTNQKPFSINESKNLMSDSKNNLKFDANNVCAACLYNEIKKKIDWEEREEKLLEELSQYRKNDGSYDCIVSGSGGKDSMYQAHILKTKYNMNPLTVTYSPILYTDVGKRNLHNWVNIGGFDNYLFSPNGKITSVLSREAFLNLLHPIQPFKFGIKNFSTKMALKLDIKLVIYGEPYFEYGSQNEDDSSSAKYDLDWIINDQDEYIAGLSFSEIRKKYNWINENDLEPYKSLKSLDIKNKDVNIIFIGWYLKWDPQEIYYYAAKNCGYEVDDERSDATYGRYSSIDDKFEWLHYYCHYIKFGIGRCRFDASQEIRNGHITRDEGIMLCKKFEGNKPERYLNDCFDHMGFTYDEAFEIIDKFRPPHLWERVKNKWHRLQELKELING